MTPLRQLEARLREIGKGVTDHPPSTDAETATLAHELHIIAVQIGLQAEQIELGLTGDIC